MRRKIIAGNWKMNMLTKGAVELVSGLRSNLIDIKECDIVFCPPYTSLNVAADLLLDTDIALGAQDLFWEKSGAYTGEVSAEMLKDIGCTYVIIGHSERRQFFGETNEAVNKKLKAALDAGLLPIVCVGEKLEEREADKTFDVVKGHVKGGLAGLSRDDMLKTTIAYEPVWAIGTGKTAAPGQAQEAHAFIRGLLKEMFDKEAAAAARIQYGGSVNPDNTAALMSQADIDGALVGGASLKVDSFTEIVKKALLSKLI